MHDCAPKDSPISKGDKFSLDQCPKSTLEHEDMESIPYASAVGSLMYAMVCTRPDLAFISGMLGRYQSNPGIAHWKAAKRVMRYLKGTKDFRLTYRHSDHLEMIGYTDSDWAGCEDTRKSTSGYIFLLAGGAVSWRSMKQTIVASSTMEAEFIGCYEASSQASWLRNFVSGLTFTDLVSRPLLIYCDNTSAVAFANNNSSGSRSKHIDIKFRKAKDRVRDHVVIFEHIRTESMLADPLTKGINVATFKDHVKNMGLNNE